MTDKSRAFRIRLFDDSSRNLKQLQHWQNEDIHLDGLNRALFMGLITWTQRSKKLPVKCLVRLELETYSAEINIPDFFTKFMAAKGWTMAIHVNR